MGSPDIMEVVQDEGPKWPSSSLGAWAAEGLARPSATGTWLATSGFPDGPVAEDLRTAPWPGPRRRHPKFLVGACRVFLACLGCLGLFTASLMVANLPAHSWVNLPVGIGVGAVSLGLLRLRRACRPWAVLPDFEAAQRWRHRATIRRRLVVACGCVLLAGAVAAATAPVSPEDPTFMSPQAACGSAVLTRSLVAHKNNPLLRTQTGLFDMALGSAVYNSDCAPTRQTFQSLAILFALVGSLSLAFSLRSRRRGGTTSWASVGAPNEKVRLCPRRGWARWPRWSVALLVTMALMGGLLTLRTSDDMAAANVYDTKAFVWVKAYADRLMPVLTTMNSMLPDIVHKNLRGLLPECQKALGQSAALGPFVAHVPRLFPRRFGRDLSAMFGHLRRGLQFCVVDSKARDFALLQRNSAPEFLAAAAASSDISEILIVR